MFMNPYQNQYYNGYQQAQTNNPTLMQVANTKQVEQVTVQAGTKTLILVQNEPIIVMKAADNMGLTTTEYYKIEKINPEIPDAEHDYITRAEFEKFVKSLKEVKDESINEQC